MEAVRAQSVAIWEACVWMAAWDGGARTTLSFCRDGQGWVSAGVCVAGCAAHGKVCVGWCQRALAEGVCRGSHGAVDSLLPDAHAWDR